MKLILENDIDYINKILDKLFNKYKKNFEEQTYRMMFTRIVIQNALHGTMMTQMETEWILNRILDDIKGLSRIIIQPNRPMEEHDKGIGT